MSHLFVAPVPACGVSSRFRRNTLENNGGEDDGIGCFLCEFGVKDIEASKLFYEKLGLTIFGGDQSQNWLILKNGDHVTGLFQEMFENNLFTFNPGWTQDAKPLAAFTDVRELQRQLKGQGVSMISEADETTTGPPSFMIADPDGNAILVDQHV